MALEVLVLRGLGLGDLLTAVPALRALRRAFPDGRITLAAPAVYRGLTARTGAVDDLVDVSGPGPVPYARAVTARGRPCPAPRERSVAAPQGPGPAPYGGPDVAVNLHGRGPQSVEALRRTDPGRLLSHEVDGGPPWRADVHETRRWCDLLGWYGIPADPADLSLGTSDLRGPVVVHPGAASPARRWPPGRFALVAAALRRGGAEVVVTGGPAEVALAREVAGRAGLPAGSVLAGRTGPAELADLIGGARLLVCGDTGVAHLATAYRTPSVVLFGPTSPALWGPPPGGPHVALWTGRTGDPHAASPDPGLLEIETSEVVDAALGLLEVRAS
ncbi:glycosyltransferase family 9 protein [Streptosporangium sp. NPDC050855]|uniref:glycosyltransferase family 9 protein n=1 Tax=Streptosporangium sp. NPDC050855 TaxID=3366194 RepID=UPI00378824D3